MFKNTLYRDYFFSDNICVLTCVRCTCVKVMLNPESLMCFPSTLTELHSWTRFWHITIHFRLETKFLVELGITKQVTIRLVLISRLNEAIKKRKIAGKTPSAGSPTRTYKLQNHKVYAGNLTQTHTGFMFDTSVSVTPYEPLDDSVGHVLLVSVLDHAGFYSLSFSSSLWFRWPCLVFGCGSLCLCPSIVGWLPTGDSGVGTEPWVL